MSEPTREEIQALVDELIPPCPVCGAQGNRQPCRTRFGRIRNYHVRRKVPVIRRLFVSPELVQEQGEV